MIGAPERGILERPGMAAHIPLGARLAVGPGRSAGWSRTTPQMPGNAWGEAALQ